MPETPPAYRMLVLTDHLTHKPSNSVYELCDALLRHPQIAEVDMASRGNPANRSFFFAYSSPVLQVFPLRPGLGFDASREGLMEHTRAADIRDYDVVWLRLPRPIPVGFFPSLTRQVSEARIINRPSGIVETSNKAYLLNFAQFCPPIQHCRTLPEIRSMAKRFPIVLKPLEDYGGRGIVRLEGEYIFDARDRMTLEEYLPRLRLQLERGGYLAMRFLPRVVEGDKRVVVVNGQILGAVLRLPAEGSWVCNAAQGGTSVPAEADGREIEMVRALNRDLLPKGIAMYGIDTLVGLDGKRVLSEVNTLSIGGIKPMAELTGKPMVQGAAHHLVDYILEHIPPNAQRPS